MNRIKTRGKVFSKLFLEGGSLQNSTTVGELTENFNIKILSKLALSFLEFYSKKLKKASRPHLNQPQTFDKSDELIRKSTNLKVT